MPLTSRRLLGDVAHAGDVVPGERGAGRGEEPGCIDAVEHLLAREIVAAALPVAGRTVARVGAGADGQGLAAHAARKIDGEYDGAGAGRIGARGDLQADLGPVAGVDLLPDFSAPCTGMRGDYVFERYRGEARQDLQRLALAGGARRGGLAIGMEGALARHRRENDRRGERLAEQADGEIDLADVDQAPCAQAPGVEGLTVGFDRAVVQHAAGEIAEMRQRNVTFRDSFEFEDVEGVGRFQDFGAEALLGEGRRERGEGSRDGRGRKIAQEASPRFRCWIAHMSLPGAGSAMHETRQRGMRTQARGQG